MATACGTKRSSLDSPARSPDGACSPKRQRRQHEEVLYDSAVAAMDVDANSNCGSSRVLRDEHRDRYHSRQRNRHGETSRGHGGSDRWIGSQGVRDDKSEREARRGGSRLEDGYKERPRSCEEVRDVEHKTRRSEEMKGKAFKEEGKEDYQEMMFNQLVFKEKGGLMKIEEARTKKISIVVKFGQHENKTALLNDSSNVARIQAEEKKNDSTQVVSINRAQCPAEQPPARADGGAPVSTATRKSGKDSSSHAQRNDNPDNWDDAEGHYTYRSGELLNGRCKVAAAHGKGVFSTVVRAKDLRAGKGDPEHVAIKIVGNNDTMNRAVRRRFRYWKSLQARTARTSTTA
jgi:serine/threonine-protein kinase PRP4